MVQCNIILVDDGTEAIGFTACANDEQNYDINEIVLFGRELTNYGGYYNTQTSSFICPVDGVYVFSVTTNVNYGDVIVTIMRNDVDLSAVWGRTDDEPFTHSTNMVVTECLAGDVVWPRVSFSGGTGGIHSNSNYCLTTFSGVLIKTV